MQLDRLLLLAAKITWRRRILWSLGLLATAGSLLLSVFFRIAFWPRLEDLRLERFDLAEALLNNLDPLMLVAGVLAICLFALVMWLLNAMAEGGIIVSVGAVEEGRAPGLGPALRAGKGLMGRFIGIDTLLFLPLFLMSIALMMVGIGGLAGLVFVATRPVAQAGDLFLVVGLSTVFGLPIALLMLVTAAVVTVLRTVAFRAAALEDLGASQSIRRGWNILRRKVLSITLLALVLWALRSVVGTPLRLVSYALVGATLAQYALTASNPASSAEWLSLLLAMAGLVVALLSWLVAGIMNAYGSVTWTIAYGQWVNETA